MSCLFTALVMFATAPRMGAWVVLDDDGGSMAAMELHARQLDSVSAQFYQCTPDGRVRHVDGIPEPKFRDVVDRAHRRHLTIFGLVGNPNFDATPVEYFLQDPGRRTTQIDALCDAARADRLDGIDIDYENLKAEDRENFSLFIEELASRLHRIHKRLAIALHAKESEPGDWGGPQAEDYARLGRAADRVRIMTYDEHEDSSPAGPVASPAWVERVMQFAVQQISPRKLEVGIPGYGYYWAPPKPRSLDWREFGILAASTPPVRDPATQELVLTTKEGVAWMCDGPAEAPKFDLARRLGIRGLYLWRLGSEDPALWQWVPSR